MKIRKSFNFLTKWGQFLRAFPPEVQLEVYHALVAYGGGLERPSMSERAAAAFAFIRPEFDQTNATRKGNPNFRAGEANPYFARRRAGKEAER